MHDGPKASGLFWKPVGTWSSVEPPLSPRVTDFRIWTFESHAHCCSSKTTALYPLIQCHCYFLARPPLFFFVSYLLVDEERINNMYCHKLRHKRSCRQADSILSTQRVACGLQKSFLTRPPPIVICSEEEEEFRISGLTRNVQGSTG